jgi:zinc protease
MHAEPLDERASLTLYAIYNPVNVEKVKTAIREELERIVKEGVGADELVRAKKGYIEEHKVDRTNDAALAAMLAETLYVDRTMSYYAELERKIDALSADDVLSALQKYVDPKRLSTVEAGDFKSADPTPEEPAAASSPAEKSTGGAKPKSAAGPSAPSKPAASKNASGAKKAAK